MPTLKGHIVKKKLFSVCIIIFFLATALLCRNQYSSAQTEDHPIIQIDQLVHTFSTVFEGEKLSYTFTVLNKGNADLTIKKITHS